MKRTLTKSLILVTAFCVALMFVGAEQTQREKKGNVSVDIYYLTKIVIISNDIHSKILKKEEVVEEVVIKEATVPQGNDLGIETYDIPLLPDVQLYVNEVCEEYNLDVDLVYAIMAQESKFGEKAYNKNSNGTVDRGLMQINTWLVNAYEKSTGKKVNAYNPYDNIDMGVWLLDYFKNKFAEEVPSKYFEVFALTAYNKGEKVALKKIGSEDGYANSVLFYKEQLKKYKTVKEWN